MGGKSAVRLTDGNLCKRFLDNVITYMIYDV
jgi:hypothetical protein